MEADERSPRPPEAIDASWLTRLLEQGGVANGAAVTAVDSLGEIGTGQAARSIRLALTWDDPDGRPASIVGKFPSTDPTARATLEAMDGYWKEWLFYDQLAATVDVRVPACHAALFDPPSSDFVLLMEDVREGSAGDQLDGLSPDELGLVVDQAARLHGPRFGDPTIPTLLGSGARSSTLADSGPFCQEMYQAVLPEFMDRYGSTLDVDVAAFIESAAPSVARWFLGTETPATFVHLDLRADNLLFTEGPRGAGVVVVDFQALAAGIGATDLAYLIGGSSRDAAERGAIERDLLAQYHGTLATYGVDHSAEQLWRDYRHGSLWGVIMTVLSSTGVIRTERGDRMFSTMANRHARHALELDGLGALR